MICTELYLYLKYQKGCHLSDLSTQIWLYRYTFVRHINKLCVIAPKLETEKPKLIDSRNWKTKYWKAENWNLKSRNLKIIFR